MTRDVLFLLKEPKEKHQGRWRFEIATVRGTFQDKLLGAELRNRVSRDLK